MNVEVVFKNGNYYIKVDNSYYRPNDIIPIKQALLDKARRMIKNRQTGIV